MNRISYCCIGLICMFFVTNWTMVVSLLLVDVYSKIRNKCWNNKNKVYPINQNQKESIDHEAANKVWPVKKLSKNFHFFNEIDNQDRMKDYEEDKTEIVIFLKFWKS